MAVAPAVREDVLADRLRDLVDARTVEGLGPTEAGELFRGVPAVQVAPAVGSYDQAHLTRRSRRLLATTPAACADSGPG